MERTLYFGGTILTMEESQPRAQALLVENGVITALGSYAQLKTEEATQVDLKGRTLMPAFVDAHSHMANMGLYALRCDLAGCTGFRDLLDRIREFRRQKGLTHGEVIRCRGYDPAIMEEGRHPDAALLDSLGFDNPIYCIHQSGHMLGCNTIAMEQCGIGPDFVDPPGGFAQRDAQGRPTGYFEEAAKNPIVARYETFTDQQYEAAILTAQEYYLSRGITTIHEGSGLGPERFACYERLARAGKLKADVVVYITSRPEHRDFWRQALQTHGNRRYESHLKIGGIKLVLDGSPQARTAWMRQPYEKGEPDYRGYPILTDERVYEILCAAIDYDLQPIAHCNGDAAAEQFLSCWERAVAEKGRGSHLRPVMIHAQTVGYDQLDRMGAVGMMPSFFVGHCFFWGDTHLENFGPQRGSRISPVKAAIDRGLPYSFHQDSPVTKPEMLHSVWCAVERRTRSGSCIGPENRVSIDQALVGVTRGAAYGYFEEDTKGVLRPGAVADLVILDRDPTETPPRELGDIRVLATVKDGKTVFNHR